MNSILNHLRSTRLIAVRRYQNISALGYGPITFLKICLVRLGANRRKNKPVFNLINSFPPQEAIVISLPFRTDRRTVIKNIFQSLRIGFSFFEAVHGHKIDLSVIPTNYLSVQSQECLSHGSIGAILSHHKVWLNSLQSSNADTLVFEDDVLPVQNFQESLKSFWKELPADYDIIYLGSGIPKYQDLDLDISAHIYRPFFPRKGMYAYVISRKGAAKLVNLIFPVKISCGGIDTIVGNLARQRLITAYHVTPCICSVNMESPSNISNLSTPGKQIHPAEFE